MLAPGIRKSWSPKYKLFGVLYHHGLSASGGHYIPVVLHPMRYASAGSDGALAWGGAGVGGGVKTREGWVRIDDELVSDVRYEDVFGAWEQDESRSAYLLFYKRVR
jgi:ubiquitin carboxyl-terminal hydrolase 10